MKRLLLVLACLCLLSSLRGQQMHRIVSWNVENLFDCEHDSLKNDYQFLPEGDYHWTWSRYWKKLDNISRTIAALGEGECWPLLVGLCEVENDTVMRDLTRRSSLHQAHYNYVMTDGPDVRGVDVALMFRPDQFHLQYFQSIRIPSQEQGLRPTRDILHVVGVVAGLDTLHVLVVHLPSRAGGLRVGALNRRLAAQTLASVADSLQEKNLVLLGDFNAEPGDEVFASLTPPLHSLVPRKRSAQLKLGGTYYFQHRWSFLDHILLSERLWQHSRATLHVGRFPFLLDENGAPWRTYRGPIYNGGFSDHLPLWTEL